MSALPLRAAPAGVRALRTEFAVMPCSGKPPPSTRRRLSDAGESKHTGNLLRTLPSNPLLQTIATLGFDYLFACEPSHLAHGRLRRRISSMVGSVDSLMRATTRDSMLWTALAQSEGVDPEILKTRARTNFLSVPCTAAAQRHPDHYDYPTFQAAVHAVEKFQSQQRQHRSPSHGRLVRYVPFVIHLQAGEHDFHHKTIRVNGRNLSIVGAGKDLTVIRHGRLNLCPSFMDNVPTPRLGDARPEATDQEHFMHRFMDGPQDAFPAQMPILLQGLTVSYFGNRSLAMSLYEGASDKSSVIANGPVALTDCRIRNSRHIGLLVTTEYCPSGLSTHVVATRCSFVQNAEGVRVRKGASLKMKNCDISRHAGAGLRAVDKGTRVFLQDCTLLHNAYGVTVYEGYERCSWDVVQGLLPPVVAIRGSKSRIYGNRYGGLITVSGGAGRIEVWDVSRSVLVSVMHPNMPHRVSYRGDCQLFCQSVLLPDAAAPAAPAPGDHNGPNGVDVQVGFGTRVVFRE